MAKKVEGIEAYCMKTKQKEVFHVAEITKSGNKFFCKGETKSGDKMCLIMSEATANEAIKSGAAKKAF